MSAWELDDLLHLMKQDAENPPQRLRRKKYNNVAMLVVDVREWIRASSTSNASGPGGQSLGWLRENVDPRAERVEQAPKLRYVYPFTKALRRQLAAEALPYPKSAAEVTRGDTSGVQPEEAGSTPSRPLHSATA